MGHHYSKCDTIIKNIALQQNTTFKFTKQIIDDFISEIINTTTTGERINIPRLGTFKCINGILTYIPANYLLKGMNKQTH